MQEGVHQEDGTSIDPCITEEKLTLIEYEG